MRRLFGVLGVMFLVAGLVTGVATSPVGAQGLAGARVFVSSSSAGTVDGVGFTRGDILVYDGTADSWAMFFDGSQAGLGSANIDGFNIVDSNPAGSVVELSFAGVTAVPGVGQVDDSDLVTFTGTSGATTAGSFAPLFDGSDVGLTSGGEDIDAVTTGPAGPVFSILGTGSAPATGGGNLSIRDEDLVSFTGTTGPATSGNFATLFDGTDVGLGSDLVAAWIDPATQQIYGSTLGNYNLGGLAGDGDDIFVFTGTTGSVTSGTFGLFFDGDQHRFGGEQIDGLHIEIGPPTDPGSADVATNVTTGTTVANPGDTISYTVEVTNNGPDPATNVVVSSAVPAGLTFVSTTGCPADPSGLPCSLGTIAPNDMASFVVTATVNPGTIGIVTVTAEASASSGDPNLANNIASDGLQVSGPPVASDDGPQTDSTPQSPYHTDIDTLYTLAAPGLLANDSLGDPAGTVTGFGGGDLGGTATDNPADQAITIGATGSLQVNADGSLEFTPDSGFTGPFTFSYRLANTGGSSDATVTIYVGPRPVAAGSLVYLTSAGSGTVDGITFEDEDIIVYNTVTDTWAMFFDGSDLGLDSADINGFTIETLEPDPIIHVTFVSPTVIPGITPRADDSDIVTFTASTTGDTTTGAFELFIDGSDLGLSSGGEDIDALAISGDDLVLSTWGSHNASGVAGSDEDLLTLTTTGTGPATSGTLAVLLDGSDVDLTAEDIWAASIDADTGDIYAASLNGFNVPGLTGDNDDIFVFTPTTTGTTTTGTFSTFFDGDTARYGGNQINGLHIAPAPTPHVNQSPTITSLSAVSVAENQTSAIDVQASDDADAEGSGLTYAIAGGADADDLSIDASTGVVTFLVAPDFEAPGDDDQGNDYVFDVTVTDSGNLTDTQTITITVTDVVEAVSTWARSFGGGSFDQGFGVAVDAAGSTYTTGNFSGTVDFDPGPGVANLTSNGGDDVFVAKLDVNGNLVWARSFGGGSFEQGRGVAVDAAGSTYTTGYFQGTVDFDPGPGVANLTSNGSSDVFVTKLDVNGNLVWARSFGGGSFEQGFGVAVDAAGSIYTTGSFSGTVDFDPGPGVANLTSNGGVDVFVTKLDVNGNLVWARSFGGGSFDEGWGVAVDASGSIYTTGSFSGTVDFDPGPGVANLTSNGSVDVFVAKLDVNGNLVWARSFGGGSFEQGRGVAVDASGSIYTTGFFQGTVDFDPGPGVANLTSNGGGDVFVTKLDVNGNLVWARSFGGGSFDQGLGVAVDAAGSTYTTGSFQGTVDFDPGPGVANLTSNGGGDVFVTKLDVNGNLVWARSFGGGSNDLGRGVAVDASGSIYTTGYFSGTVDFDPGSGVANLISNGSGDVFVTKLPTDGPTLDTSGTILVAENTTAVADLGAIDDSDTEGSGLTYTVTGGDDQTLFTLDTNSGQLDFTAAPDFETPTDADTNNTYLVEVTVTDTDTNAHTAMLVVTVTDVVENAAPTITSLSAVSVAENQTSAIDVQASDDADAEGSGLAYAIAGGADADDLSIDASTGVVTFLVAPDFEAPGDDDQGNDYVFDVTVTDSGNLTDTQTITITVTDVVENAAPTITSLNTASVAENQTSAIDVQATDDADAEGSGLLYAITGGADADDLSIDASTGVVTFLVAPDFEAPGDDDQGNDYVFDVTVTDSGNLTDTQTVTVTVTDVVENAAPTITSLSAVSVAENQTSAIDVQATDDADAEGSGLTYAIAGGADADDLSIDASTGVVTFLVAPDFEAPGDDDQGNDYVFDVTVTDSGNLTDTQTVTITVTDVVENAAPTITSLSAVSVAENQTSAIDVQATDDADAEGSGLAYAIAGGADADDLSIDASTGVVTFLVAPDFEAPGDDDGGNDYVFEVTVTDSGNLMDTQTVTITVTDVVENAAPTITSLSAVSVAENQTSAIDVQASDDADAEGSGLTYAIAGGADADDLSIDALTGVVTFLVAPDFEAPGDDDQGNDYVFDVTVTDSGNLTDTQTITVTVTDVVENAAPTITSLSAVSVAENQTSAIDVQASDDADAEGSGLLYAITGGADADDLSIDASTGVVTFLVAPDFEAPGDDDTNNDYVFDVTVTDSGNLTDTQTITITVTDVVEAVSTWARSFGGGSFEQGFGVAVDAAGSIYTTGSFQGTVDFDPGPEVANLTSNGSADVFVTKLDANGNLVWTRSFGGTSSDEGRGVAVDTTGNTYTTGYFQGTVDFDPGPGVANLTSNGGGDVFVTKLDVNGNLVWARSFGGGSFDQGWGVAVDAAGSIYTTGYFRGTVDFDPGPGVANLTSNGSDDVFVTKLDVNGNLVWARSFGGGSSDEGLGVAVDAAGSTYTTGNFSGTVDFDPGPGVANLTSNGSDDVFVTKLDVNGNLVWARSFGGGSNDQGFGVAVDAAGSIYTTGYFQGTVDFDPGPGVANLTSNGGGDVFVTKLDVNGNLVWARSFGGGSNELGWGVAVDAAGSTYTTGYFSGTVDFDPGPGVANLTSNGGDDVFVTKLDVNGNLVWARSFGGGSNDRGWGVAVDASGSTYTTGYFQGTVDFDPGPGVANLTSSGNRDVFVTKLPTDGPTLDTSGTILVAENTTAVADLGAIDDSDTEGSGLTYTVTGGDDQALFTLDTNSGQLDFTAAPDFETPTDADTNNTYLVEVTVTDTDTNAHTAMLEVTVTDVVENAAPTITSLSAVSVAENQTSAIDVQASDDADAEGSGLAYAITGGADADDLSIDASTGVVTFNTAPDFEAPGDDDQGNDYVFDVTVTDSGNLTDTQTVTITVTDVVEAVSTWARSFGGGSFEQGFGVAVDAAGSIYTTGYFEGTVDFDPGLGVANLTSNGGGDVFVTKLDVNGNLVWARSFGGGSFEQGRGVAVDASGSIYTTGFFQGTVDFDPGSGVANLTSNGGGDVFVTKLDVNGNLVWARSFGGGSFDIGWGVAVDAAGSTYTTGLFQGTVDFDPGPGVANLTSNGSDDVFVTKLDVNGNLVWARSFGGGSSDQGFGVAVDAAGSIYTTGYFSGTVDFDPGPGVANLTSNGSGDVFVTKLDVNGNLVWARSFGGGSFDQGFGVAVDAAGSIYTTGYFQGTVDFDPGPGVANLTSNGGGDVFVTKLDVNGNLVWARSFGGSSFDQGRGVAVDAAGSIYTTGYFRGTVDFDPGPGVANLTSNGSDDVFVTKLDVNGNLVWARSFGGSSFDQGWGVAVDAAGSTYTTGYFQGTVDFDPGPGVANLTSNGSGDVFVTKLDTNGNLS